eukprot:1443948-Pleurochrysis_carterae.AAC.9
MRPETAVIRTASKHALTEVGELLEDERRSIVEPSRLDLNFGTAESSGKADDRTSREARQINDRAKRKKVP